MQEKIVILGAGPTGLGAAYRLAELGYTNFHMYDRLPYLGGLAASFTDSAGFTWDIGGHVMFSHYTYYDKVFDELMGDDFQLNMRESWVRMFDTWVPYPLQNNIRYLPAEVTCECLAGLIEAQTRRDHLTSKNFAQFMDAVFGDGLVRHFMRPYNFKVWAHPPELMNKQWIGERVAVIDINRALKNVIMGTDDFGWGPNNQFKFPLFGGTGEFYRRFAKPLAGHYTLEKKAQSIDLSRKLIRFIDGELVHYDKLITAMPLDKLCNIVIGDQIPGDVRRSAAGLRHSGGHMVGVGIRQPCPSTKSWMYFPEDNCPFYRVTYLSNYSPHMTPDNATHYSLLCETSYSEFKPVDKRTIVDDTIAGLVNAGLIKEADLNDVVDVWHFDADYSYPTPSVERDEILAKVIPFLEVRGVYSRGRFGMWKYEVSNTDHSLMQGVELVNRLLLGEPETTIGLVYESTADGRNADGNVRRAASHIRSSVAGSGDPGRSNSRINGAPVGDLDEADLAEEELGVTTYKIVETNKLN
jgi:protoporphyrinogen oxidase